MDDCNLDKLSVKPGKLSPAFKKNVLEYHVTLGSQVEQIEFDCMTSDTGASYSISGSGGSRTVPLVEGKVNDIKIEVTAEDGTTKNYMVYVRRLSAKDATLSNLTVSTGCLDPEFTTDVYQYSCTVACDITSISIKPAVLDAKTTFTISDGKPDTPLPLNFSNTKFEVFVTSPDGSNKQIYTITVSRKQIPRHIRFADPQMALTLTCPVSLNALYQPVSIRNSDPKHAFSGPIIDEFTKTSKTDPLSGNNLEPDWRMEDYDMEKKLSAAIGSIPMTTGGTSEQAKLSELGALLKSCNKMPNLGDLKDKFQNTSFSVKHTVEVRKWEKQLVQVFGETDGNKLAGLGDEHLGLYFNSLPKIGQSKQYSPGESPLDYLENAAQFYAAAIKAKKQNAQFHLKLGLILEERYYAEDMYGLKVKDDVGVEVAGLNLEAQESSKAEECAAICRLRGVGEGAPLSLQLKAIDQEYHHLLDSGQSGKADHVQGLYLWKNKQATQEGAAAQKASDDMNPLGQAYLKYMDAVTLEESKAMHNFHVGRLLVIQGNYEEAVKRLEATLNWNSQLQMARFYLGLALSLQKGGCGARSGEAITYLQEAMETLLQQNTKQALSSENNIEGPFLMAEHLLRNTNVHLLRGVIQLGKLLAANPQTKDTMSPQDVFHTAALLASQVLPSVHRGDLYQQIEWVLLEAHSLLLDILLVQQKDNTPLIVQRCEWLSSLINRTTIPQNPEILTLQMKTCQKLALIQSCSSNALCLLGSTQLSQYDNDPSAANASTLLEDAKKSFEAAIGLEGKPASGEPPAGVTGQQWWQDRIKAEEEKKKAEEAKKTATKPAAAGRGGATARGAPRGGAAAPRGAAKPAARGAARGAPAGRGAAAMPVRGAAAARGTARGGATRGAAVSKTPSKTTTTPSKPGSATRKGSTHSCDEAKAPASTAAPVEEKMESSTTTAAAAKPAPINRKSHQPRLGLARALSRTPDLVSEAHKYYEEVMKMAPEVHDAYIESAEMLTKTDPMAAVDVYCKFPKAESTSFDDAYIYGEIVRLLMKHEKFDDPRLGPNMISIGKIMGIGYLEKYVEILDAKYKTDLLMSVYAGVNGKDVDDPDMKQFFKFKCWI